MWVLGMELSSFARAASSLITEPSLRSTEVVLEDDRPRMLEVAVLCDSFFYFCSWFL